MELRHKVLCLRSIRGHKFLRFAGFVLIACALVLMLRTSSDYYGTSDQILNSVENHFVVVPDKVFSSDVVEKSYNSGEVSTPINFIDPVTIPASVKRANKKKKKKANGTDENDQSFNIAVQPLIHQTVNILDKYMDMDSTNYQAIRSVFIVYIPVVTYKVYQRIWLIFAINLKVTNLGVTFEPFTSNATFMGVRSGSLFSKTVVRRNNRQACLEL